MASNPGGCSADHSVPQRIGGVSTSAPGQTPAERLSILELDIKEKRTGLEHLEARENEGRCGSLWSLSV